MREQIDRLKACPTRYKKIQIQGVTPSIYVHRLIVVITEQQELPAPLQVLVGQRRLLGESLCQHGALTCNLPDTPNTCKNAMTLSL